MDYRVVTLDAEIKTKGFRIWMPPLLNVQAFLEKQGSGLAKTRVGAWMLSSGRLASEIIRDAALEHGVRPEYLLVTLESEQGLVHDTVVHNANYKLKDLTFQTDIKPAPPQGFDRVVATNPAKSGGIKWVAVSGEWKIVAALGMGIPDPGVPPAGVGWDVRPYLGLDNQIKFAAKQLRRYVDRWNAGDKLVVLYPTTEEKIVAKAQGRKPVGETIVAGDPETYALLQYTPSPSVLVDRPRIFMRYFA